MPFIDLPDRIPGLRAQARSDRPWYRITNQTADEAEVMLYDEVGGWLGATADEFIADLRGISASKILLRVNSPGGSVTEGIAIANALRSHPASVTVQVDGIAASIASVIAMAGDRVRMMPNALLMVHDASGLCVGDAAEMIKMAELLDKISDNIAGAYAARAGGTEAEWRQVMKNETWYRGEEAVEAGLADEVVPMPKRGGQEPEPEMRKEFDLAAYGYTGPKQAPAPEPVARQTEPEDTAVGPHSTSTTEGTWDASAQEKKLPSPMPVVTARKMYGWYDSGKAEDGKVTKDACKLPHHQVSEDGTPGAAVMAGVRNALARLPQTQGLSDAERSTIERHLRAHLKAGGGGEEDHAPDETAGRAEPDPPPAAPPATEPDTTTVPGSTHETDGWAALTAHLTTPDTGDWATLVAHLTTPASSRAATEA